MPSRDHRREIQTVRAYEDFQGNFQRYLLRDPYDTGCLASIMLSSLLTMADILVINVRQATVNAK